MALNVNKQDAGRLTLLSQETILQHHDNVEFSLDSGNLSTNLKGTRKGNVYLTNHRVVFITKSSKPNETLQSFSMPFRNMKNVEVKQPIFGANKIVGLIKAQPDGGWEGQANFKIDFNSGGAIEFGQRLVRVASKATNHPTQGMQQHPNHPMSYSTHGNPYTPSTTCYGNPYTSCLSSNGNPYVSHNNEKASSQPQQPQPPQFYPQPIPNANMYGGNPYPNASAPPAGYPGYPPPGGNPLPGGYPPPGSYPQGMAYQAPPTQDPAYPPPAYSTAVGQGYQPSAPPVTDPVGNAYYNPTNPQQAYIPQTNPPVYSEKPKME